MNMADTPAAYNRTHSTADVQNLVATTPAAPIGDGFPASTPWGVGVAQTATSTPTPPTATRRVTDWNTKGMLTGAPIPNLEGVFEFDFNMPAAPSGTERMTPKRAQEEIEQVLAALERDWNCSVTSIELKHRHPNPVKNIRTPVPPPATVIERFIDIHTKPNTEHRWASNSTNPSF